MVYIIDTHALIWFLEGNPRLGSRAKKILMDDAALKIIPSIVLAEIHYLHSRGRITTSFKKVKEMMDETENCVIYPLDENVIEVMPRNLNIHDALICATGILYETTLHENACVVTKDEEIAESGRVETLWT